MTNNCLPHTHPFVSVIIPCFNDEKGIQDTLESISAQDYPADRWEVIVVDNNSTDNTQQVARSFSRKIPSLKVKQEKRQSSYAARNKGISIAQGDIIAFIDSDMTVKPDWFKRFVFEINKYNADYIGSRVDILTKKNPTIYEIYNQKTGFPIKYCLEKSGFSPTCSLIIKKSVIAKCGAFDEKFISGGDKEFGNRVKRSGLKMHYSDVNIVFHPARKSFLSLLKKQFRVGRGFYQLCYRYPEQQSEFLRNILNPIHYGPLNPERLKNNILRKNFKWNNIRVSNKMKFYFIYWIEKVFCHCGYCYEYLIAKKHAVGQSTN